MPKNSTDANHTPTEDQDKITQIAVAQRSRQASIGGAYPLPDSDAAYTLRAAVHEEAVKHRLISMGALGDVRRVISAIPREAIRPNPLHPRDNWRLLDDSLRQLCDVMEAAGQPQRVVCTTLDPRDPDAQKFRVALIDGHRIWRAAEIVNEAMLEVEVIEHPDGRPLTASEMLQWYLLNTMLAKPLTMEQLVGGYAQYAEAAEAEGRPVNLAPLELAERHHLNKATTSRVVGILNEPGPVRSAVAAHVIQPFLVIKLWSLLPNVGERLKLLLRLIEVNRERLQKSEPRLTIDEALSLGRQWFSYDEGVATSYSSYQSLVRARLARPTYQEQAAAALLDLLVLCQRGQEDGEEFSTEWQPAMATLLPLARQAHALLSQRLASDLPLIAEPIADLMSGVITIVEAD